MIGMGRGVCLTMALILGVLSSKAGNPPAQYVENKNQWPAEFHYAADFPQVRIMLKDASVFFIQHEQIPRDGKGPKKEQTIVHESALHGSGETALATFELKFLNALKPNIIAGDKRKTIYNYYRGDDRSKWAGGASSFGEVTYQQVYNGIDLRLYSQDDHVKYDWIVSPCADPDNIKFYYDGVDDADIKNENLVVRTKLGEFVETKPYAYQIVNGQRRTVVAAFEMDDVSVSFVFPEGYDSNYELIIDPFLIFSGYSGSTLDNWGNTATFDSKGNLYSGGMVFGALNAGGFPTTPGVFQTRHSAAGWDVGILKYDSAGANLLYATYLGGSGTETPQSLVVNANDELLVLGATSSPDFPGAGLDPFKGGVTCDPLNGVVYDGGSDLFVARLSVNGSQLLASTLIGGTANDGLNFVSGDMGTTAKVESRLSRNYGDQLRGDIIADNLGNVFIASNTLSDDFPIVNSDPNAAWHGGTHDAVVVKFDINLNVVWTRLLGGSLTDAAYSIKIHQNGNIYVAGGTSSVDVAGMNGLIKNAPGGASDGWIAELTPDGEQILNATYVGTNRYDQVYFIDISTTGTIVAYGQTQGAYPIFPAGGVYASPNSGQFLHSFTEDLKTTKFSTAFGSGSGGPDISPTAFLVNACDNIYVAGWGGSINSTVDNFSGITRNYVGGSTQNLPFTPDAWQPHTSGNDFYLMVLNNNAQQLVYATFLGGLSSTTHVDGGTSRFDKRGIVYHSVCASCGPPRDDFPAYNVPPERSRDRSSNCNNAAFKFNLSSLSAGIQTNNVQLTSPGFNSVCIPDGIVFQNTTVGGEIFEWDFGDGTTENTISRINITHFYKKPGTYTVKLVAIDNSTCIGIDSTETVVSAFIPDMNGGPDLDVCHGSSVRLTARGGVSYAWKSADNRFLSSEQNPLITPDKSQDYYVTITDAGGCVVKDTLSVYFVPGVDVKFDYAKVFDCTTRPYITVTDLTELKPGEESTFVFGDGLSEQAKEIVHTYDNDGVYNVSLQVRKEFCVYQTSKQIPIITFKLPNVITPGQEDGLNDTFKLAYGTPPQPRDGFVIGLKIIDRWGKQVYNTLDYKDDWRGDDVSPGVYYYEADLNGEVQCKGWIHLIK